MRLSPLDLQWVLNAEFLPLAAVTLVTGALGDRFGQKRIFLAGIALYGLAIRRQRHAAPSLFASQTGVGATERSRSC